MGNTSETGADKVKVESYQCSIKKVTASTEWEAPGEEVSETVTTTVFDSDSGEEGKTIYIISSPEGKTVTIKTERKEGKCKRESHKKFNMLWDDFEIDKTKDVSIASRFPPGRSSSLFDLKLPFYPYVYKRSPQNKEKKIKNEEDFTIKCFEIGGAIAAFKYLKFPVPVEENYVTTFKYVSCKENSIQYKIISYPDISFKVEFSIGSDVVKNKNGTSKFEKKTSSIKRVPTQLKEINSNSLGLELEFSSSLNLSVSYNKEKDKLALTINFDKEKEVGHFSYQHDNKEEEYSTEAIQDLFFGDAKKLIDLLKLLDKISRIDFLKELTQFNTKSLVKIYKPYTLKLGSPNILLTYEGKYQTSKDLTRIGKYIDFSFVCEPLISISLTVDLLFLILSAATAGTGTGFYVMLKRLDIVIGKILGASYKKKYENAKPFEADVFFNLIVTGAINGGIHWIIDTTEERNANSSTASIEGVLKVDLEAGAKCSLDVFIVAVEGEASASGSTGIKIKFTLENHILQGRGLVYVIDGIFLGLKIKYCIKGKVGLTKSKSYGGSLVDGDATLLEKTKMFSGRWTIFAD